MPVRHTYTGFLGTFSDREWPYPYWRLASVKSELCFSFSIANEKSQTYDIWILPTVTNILPCKKASFGFQKNFRNESFDFAQAWQMGSLMILGKAFLPPTPLCQRLNRHEQIFLTVSINVQNATHSATRPRIALVGASESVYGHQWFSLACCYPCYPNTSMGSRLTEIVWNRLKRADYRNVYKTGI